MIGPKPFHNLAARVLDAWRRLTMSAAAFEDRRVDAIHREMGGALSRDEVRRIVRAHRL